MGWDERWGKRGTWANNSCNTQAGRNSCSGSTPSRSSSRARRPSTQPAPLKPPLLYENGTYILCTLYTRKHYYFFRHLRQALDPSICQLSKSFSNPNSVPAVDRANDRSPLTQQIPIPLYDTRSRINSSVQATLFYDSAGSLLSSLLLYLNTTSLSPSLSSSTSLFLATGIGHASLHLMQKISIPQ